VQKKIWIGRVISALPILMLTMSAVMKLSSSPEGKQALEHSGIPETLVPVLMILEVLALVLYAIPKTAYVGAILITGYMGGAIFAHLRIGEPAVIQTLLPILAWLGLYLRDERLKNFIPLNSK
jgi:hypothetical protein